MTHLVQGSRDCNTRIFLVFSRPLYVYYESLTTNTSQYVVEYQIDAAEEDPMAMFGEKKKKKKKVKVEVRRSYRAIFLT